MENKQQRSSRRRYWGTLNRIASGVMFAYAPSLSLKAGESSPSIGRISPSIEITLPAVDYSTGDYLTREGYNHLNHNMELSRPQRADVLEMEIAMADGNASVELKVNVTEAASRVKENRRRGFFDNLRLLKRDGETGRLYLSGEEWRQHPYWCTITTIVQGLIAGGLVALASGGGGGGGRGSGKNGGDDSSGSDAGSSGTTANTTGSTTTGSTSANSSSGTGSDSGKNGGDDSSGADAGSSGTTANTTGSTTTGSTSSSRGTGSSSSGRDPI